MLRLLIEKELRDIIGSTKFVITFAVCAVLILLAFYVGARNYQVSQDEYSASLAENLKQMEELTDWNQVSHRIFLPPQPLAALVSGISNDIGRNIEVERRGELTASDSRFNEDPLFAVFRFLDLEFIFTVVLSLFAILFGYDAVNGEKERGTLRLSFANSIPRDKYILGKILGSLIALIVPLLIPVLVGFLMLLLMGIPMDGGSWLRLTMIVGTGMLYFSVFLTLSVFISALTERSSSSFLMMLVVWIFAVLIVPRTAVLLSGRAVDVPSMDQINYEKRQYEEQMWSEDRKEIDAFWQQSSTQNREQRMAEFRTLMGELMAAREDKQKVFFEQLNEDRRNREAVQQKLALNISRISPAASFSLASADLAGTSLDMKQQFQASANAYQSDYDAFITAQTGEENAGRWWRGGGNIDEDAEAIDPQLIPQFTYREPPADEIIGGAIPDIAILLLFNLMFFAGAFVAFLKYDVR